MTPPLVADTGGLLRALARRSNGRAAWPDYEAALREASAVIVPALILAQVDYFLRAERTAMRKLVREIVDPETTYELEPVSAFDLARALQLDAKFHESQIGLVDGVVAAVAERRRVLRVLTVDRRDFAALRVGPRYSQALQSQFPRIIVVLLQRQHRTLPSVFVVTRQAEQAKLLSFRTPIYCPRSHSGWSYISLITEDIEDLQRFVCVDEKFRDILENFGDLLVVVNWKASCQRL